MENSRLKQVIEWFRNKRDTIKVFLAECVGTLVLILFGCGAVAQMVLSQGVVGQHLTVHIGFTLGVMMAAHLAGGVSGAHVNPAVSAAMVILGKLPWRSFPLYVAAQFVGAFLGAVVVFILYYDALTTFNPDQFIVTGVNATANIFASYPAKHLSILGGFIDQVIGTGALVLCVLAIIDMKNIGAPKGLEPLCVAMVVMAISVSMGLNCGYPINPARDLSPRIFTAMAGWGSEVFSAGGCWWWVPVVGPMVGAVVGAGMYYVFIEMHHPAPKKDDNIIPENYEVNLAFP